MSDTKMQKMQSNMKGSSHHISSALLNTTCFKRLRDHSLNQSLKPWPHTQK